MLRDRGKNLSPLSRRLFLACGAGLGASAGPAPVNTVHFAFTLPECEVRVAVEFYDRYTGRRPCAPGAGEPSVDCTANFTGSLAIVCYRFRPLSTVRKVTVLREHVLTIDQDARLNPRPPFDRAIELDHGVASDIQAFGFETAPLAGSADAQAPEAGGPWYYFRQDLYLGAKTEPFLVVHWRHGLHGIRLLDMIPAGGTRASG
jgi:hypothetical protein